MNSKRNELLTRTVGIAVPVAALTAAVCLTLAFFLDFDKGIGYFASASILPRIAVCIFGAFVLLIAADAIFFLKAEDVSRTDVPRIGVRIAAGLAAASFLFFGFSAAGLASESEAGLYRVLLILAVIFSLPSAEYLLTVLLAKTGTIRQVCSLFVPLFGAALLGMLYFDYFTPINGPVKLPLQIALVAFLFAVLYEIRLLIGKGYARPRAAFALSLICGMLCVGVSVPVLAATFAGILTFSVYTACATPLLCFGIYQFSRSLSLLIPDRTCTDAVPCGEVPDRRQTEPCPDADLPGASDSTDHSKDENE